VVLCFFQPFHYFQQFLCLKRMIIVLIQMIQLAQNDCNLYVSMCRTELIQLDLEWRWSGKNTWQNWFIQKEMKWSNILQLALILWDLSIQGVGGCRLWKFVVILLRTSMYLVQCLVLINTVSNTGSAYLAGASSSTSSSTYHWVQNISSK